MNRSCAIALSGILVLSACGEQNQAERPAPMPSKVMSTVEASKPASPVLSDIPLAKEVPAKSNEPARPTESTQANSAATPKEKTEIAVISKSATSSKNNVLSHDDALALAGKSGCLACHKIETKLIGPAWRNVSKRYKGDSNAKAKLVSSVKSGSKGKWAKETGGMPMPANSPRVSDEDIDKLVNFILSL